MRTLAALMLALATLSTTTPAAALCVGDCNLDAGVTVDEIIVGVNIALGSTPADECMAIDGNLDRQVTVDEIITAVSAALTGCPAEPPRLIAASRDGAVASVELSSPWAVKANTDLGLPTASARCGYGRCVTVHPAPADSLTFLDVSTLLVLDRIGLDRGADPRDVALVDDHTLVVSQYGRPNLLVFDLMTRVATHVDLSPLADADGLPEMTRLASCGRRVFVQLRRVDHDSDAPADVGAALAVVDLDRAENDRLVDVDPSTPGVQGIALAGRPDFDMPVDCSGGTLYVVEPAPLFQGGGSYEQVDLETLRASDLPIDTGAQVGGFEVVGENLYWLITHTDIGPGPSSHLNQVGGDHNDTYNTFAESHVDELAYDPEGGLLFFPDPCATINWPACIGGVQAFDALSGEYLTPEGIDVGFPPVEVAVSR